MKYWAFFIFSITLFACDEIQKKQNEEIKVPSTAVELGEKLFFDNILSSDNSISCASCHIPEFAFADTAKLSKGVGGQFGTRNTPSSMNMLSRSHFFWDGRATSLEDQASGPIANPVEMNLPIKEAVRRLKDSPMYQDYFQKIYKHEPDSAFMVRALASFMRSLEGDGTSDFDKWMSGDNTAMTESQIRGHELFKSDKSKCFDCHFSPDFTGDEFRNIGTYDGKDLNDVGRFEVTKDSSDLGKFKTPGLRNVAVTGPYMHNGMFETLEEVIEYYNNPYEFVQHPVNMDSLMIEPLNLTKQEKEDLVNFLHALTDSSFVRK